MLTTKPFGAFVELHGYRTHGLVHISQLAQYRVEAVEDVVESGSWVRANPNPSPNPNRSRSRSRSRSLALALTVALALALALTPTLTRCGRRLSR